MDGLTPVEQRAPGRWQIATVREVVVESRSAKSFTLEVPTWLDYCPGQHYDVRLTAPDGYTAQRSYSIASAPLERNRGTIQLTIDRLDDGEVSPYFHDVVEPGDQVEVRGPFASYFVWRGESPVLLIGGGSGVVPLMSMLRWRREALPEVPMRLIYSVRGPEDVIYARELEDGEETLLTYSRLAPPAWSGHEGRIDAGDDRRGGHRSRGDGARLRLRLARLRRDRGGAAHGRRLGTRADPHRALRPDRLSGPDPGHPRGLSGVRFLLRIDRAEAGLLVVCVT